MLIDHWFAPTAWILNLKFQNVNNGEVKERNLYYKLIFSIYNNEDTIQNWIGKNDCESLTFYLILHQIQSFLLFIMKNFDVHAT